MFFKKLLIGFIFLFLATPTFAVKTAILNLGSPPDDTVTVTRTGTDMVFNDGSNVDILLSDLTGATTGWTVSGDNVFNTTPRVGIGSSPGFSPDEKLNITGTISFNEHSAPSALTATVSGSAGNVENGTHSYKVNFVVGFDTEFGTLEYETEGSTKSNVITVSGGAKQVDLTAIPTGQVGVVRARRIYRTVAGDAGDWLFLAEISDNTTTILTDDTADGSLGAAINNTNETAVIRLRNAEHVLLIDKDGNMLARSDTGNLNFRLPRDSGDDIQLHLENETSGSPTIFFEKDFAGGLLGWMIGADSLDNFVFSRDTDGTPNLNTDIKMSIESDGDLILTKGLQLPTTQFIGTIGNPLLIQLTNFQIFLDGEVGINTLPEIGNALAIEGNVRFGTGTVGFGDVGIKANTVINAGTTITNIGANDANAIRGVQITNILTGDSTSPITGILGSVNLLGTGFDYTNTGGYAAIKATAFTGPAGALDSTNKLYAFQGSLGKTGLGTLVEGAGLKIETATLSAGNIDILYGALIDSQTVGDLNYGLVVLGSMPNYFLGPLGLGGVTSPSFNLDLLGDVRMGGASDETTLMIHGKINVERDVEFAEITILGDVYTPAEQEWGFRVAADGSWSFRDYTLNAEIININNAGLVDITGSIQLLTGTDVDDIVTDTTLAVVTDNDLVTALAIKTYHDNNPPPVTKVQIIATLLAQSTTTGKVTIPTMTFTIVTDGDYFVEFSGRTRMDDKDGGGEYSIFLNAVEVTHTIRGVNDPVSQGSDGFETAHTQALLTGLVATDIVDVRFERTTAPGNFEFTNRSLYLELKN